MIFFCGELFETEGLRKAFIQLMQETVWKGWEIRWAYKGIIDIVEYLDLDVDDHLA